MTPNQGGSLADRETSTQTPDLFLCQQAKTSRGAEPQGQNGTASKSAVSSVAPVAQAVVRGTASNHALPPTEAEKATTQI